MLAFGDVVKKTKQIVSCATMLASPKRHMLAGIKKIFKNIGIGKTAEIL